MTTSKDKPDAMELARLKEHLAILNKSGLRNLVAQTSINRREAALLELIHRTREGSKLPKEDLTILTEIAPRREVKHRLANPMKDKGD